MKVEDYDAFDVVCLCHAGLAQDTPEYPTVYFNQILNIMFGYLTSEQRKEVEVPQLPQKGHDFAVVLTACFHTTKQILVIVELVVKRGH